MNDYSDIKHNELRSSFTDFSVSKEMQNAVKNDIWRSKYGLWTVLSAACDDAGAKCNDYINSFADKLIDVDTCTVEALKSIAKSVDLEFLVRDIPNDYPLELKELIDVLSISKSNLLGSPKTLNEDAVDKNRGPVVRRQAEYIDLDDFNMNLLYDIKKNVSHLRNILNMNMIHESKTFEALLKPSTLDYLKEQVADFINSFSIDQTFEINNPGMQAADFDKQAALAEAVADLCNRREEIITSLNETLNGITLNTVLNKIEEMKLPELKNFVKKKLFVDEFPALKVDIRTESSHTFFTFGYNVINWFWVLELICKDNVYDEKNDVYIVPLYFNKELNIEVDLTGTFGALLNPILYKNERYIKDFIYFHIYETLKSKLVNKFIFKSFDIIYNRKVGYHTIILNDYLNEMSEDEFTAGLRDRLDEEEADSFLEQQYPKVNEDGVPLMPLQYETIKLNKNYNPHFVDFAIYSKFISSIFDKIDQDGSKLSFNMLQLNFSESKVFRSDKSYYNKVIGPDGVISKCAKILTDICLKIANAREAIKIGIQQYALIGTRRIATDILVDFFLKNFSSRSDWDYISDLSVISNGDVLSGILKPMSTLLDENTRFSIDVVEYYDISRYLNIKSGMPLVKTGTSLKDVGSKVSWYIDQNNLIASAVISSGIYEDVYQPCSYFVSDYNPRFWEDSLVSIKRRHATSTADTAIVRFDMNEYDKFYSQYDPELNGIAVADDKTAYISSTLKPLLNKIWDTFALSAIGSDIGTVGAIGDVYKEYIGSDIGTDRYRNNENVHFPTIAAAINIDNLVEVSKFDSIILFVAKEYYHNVVEKIASATTNMLRALDRNGVPTEGWRQSRTDFHGYSTYYEFASNKSAVSDSPNARIDVDGAWSYEVLRKLEFLYIDGKVNASSISSIMKFIIDEKVSDIVDSHVFSIEDVIAEYLMSPDCVYAVKNSLAACHEYSIAKVEYDSSNSYFTLLKKQDEPLGFIMFREASIPLSVPFKMVATNGHVVVDGIVSEIINIAENCYDFGIVDDVIWMFGKSNDKYKLISVKFWIEFNHIAIDTSTYVTYSQDMNTLNDFVGAVLDNDTLTFVIFNSYDFMYELASRKATVEHTDTGLDEGLTDDDILANANINFNIFKLDIPSNKVDTAKAGIDKALTPMILNDTAPVKNGKKTISFYDEHHIWKTEKFDGRCYVAYEALNFDNENRFSYYLGFDSSMITFKVYQLEFYENYYYAGKSQAIGSRDTLMFSPSLLFNNRYESIILENSAYTSINMSALNTAINKKLAEYPKCLLKDGKLVIEFLGFTFFKDSSVLYREYIAEKVAKRIRERFNFSQFDGTEPSSIVFEASDFIKTLSGEHTISKSEGDLATDSIDYVEDIKTSMNVFKDNPVLTSFTYTFNETADLIKNLPFVKSCMNDELKIICFFKNDTGINFINDYALDLDLTCYIDDEFERDRRVGYGNKYTKTRYIEWDGDRTKGGYEYLSIDVRKYINERFENKSINKTMTINLNLCWHETTELKLDEVTVAVCWDFLREDIPIRLIKTAPKDCKNKVLTLKIDMETQILSWIKPQCYPVVKIAYKDKIVATEDGIPDVQVGFINLNEDDIMKLDGWEANGYYVGNEFVTDFYAYRNEIDTFKHSSKKTEFITFILNQPLPDTRLDNVQDYIIHLLDCLVKIKSNKLNYVTKQRLGSVTYSGLKVADIYFGEEHPVIDSETGIGYAYYGYLNPTYFKEIPAQTVRPIDAALVDYRMSYAIQHDFTFTKADVLNFKREIFSIVQPASSVVDGFELYVDSALGGYSVDGYFSFMQEYDPEYYEAALDAIYQDYKLPDTLKEDVKSDIRMSIIGYATMDGVDDYIDNYAEVSYKQDMSVRGFYQFMIEYHNDYYLRNLQASYRSLNS